MAWRWWQWWSRRRPDDGTMIARMARQLMMTTMKSYSAGWLDDNGNHHRLEGRRRTASRWGSGGNYNYQLWSSDGGGGAIDCQYISLLVLMLSVGVCCGVFCVSLACCGCLLFVFGVWNSATDKILLNTVTHGVIALMDKYHLWMVDGTSASSWFKENLYMDLCSCYQNWIHQLTLIRKWDISNPCFLIGISATRGRDILHLQMKIDRGMWATRVTAHLLPFPLP